MRLLAGSIPRQVSSRQELTVAAALAGSEHIFTRAVMDSIEVGIVACDTTGQLTVFNRAAQQFHGLPPDPTVPARDCARAFDLYTEDGISRLEPEDLPLRRALVDGEVHGQLIWIAPPGSVPRIVRCDGRRLLTPTGAPGGAVVAMTDVTEARRAALDLTRERDLARSIVRTASDAYVRADQGGRITEWNPAAERLFGWSAADVLDHDLLETLAGARLPEYRNRLDRFRRSGVDDLPGRRVELILEHRTRQEVPVEVTLWPTRTDEGWDLHAFVRDISGRIGAAQALARAHRDMTQALDAMPRSITLTTVERDASGRAVDLRVVWINAYVRDLTGMAVEEVAGRSFGDVFPTVSVGYLPTYLVVAETRQPLHLPVDWFVGEQIRGSFDVTVSPWSEDGLLIDAVDVTARRSAEAALRLSEKRLREAQTLAGLASWEWDIAGGTLTWAPLMFRLLGVDPGVTPEPDLMTSLVHPGDRDRFRGYVRAVSVGATDSTITFRVIRPAGGVVHIRAVTTVERDPDGRLTRAWGTDQDVTAARVREEELTDEAHRDALTGLLNRRGWGAQTAAALRRRQPGDHVVVVMIDLDHFKTLNDLSGHAAGDTVLQLCAERWSGRLRAGDVLARLGGEEFGLLLSGCTEEAAVRIVEALRAVTPTVTASAGVACVGAEEAVTSALERADAALYRAKQAGRDRTVAAS